MKKKIFAVIIATIILITSVSAQDKSVHIGLKAGINFSMFKVSDLKSGAVSSIKNDNGFYAGTQVEIRLSKKFSIQPEILYITDGVVDYEPSGSGSDRVLNNETLSHISIPILAKLHVGHLGIYAGPQISMLTSATIMDHVNYTGKMKVTNESYTKTSFSGIVGLEYTFKYRFGVDARYQFGLSNVSASNGTTPLTYVKGQNIKLSGFQAGLYFRFGKKPQKNS